MTQSASLRTTIPYGRHIIEEDDIKAVTDVLRNGALTQGPKIREFEEAVASYVGARYAVAVSSGTAALHLACQAAGIGPGDAGVTSPLTFVASANCLRYVGAHVGFADIRPETLNIDPESADAALSSMSRAKVLIPVHFAGLPCDMPSLRKVADQRGCMVIEDASHALGAQYPEGGRVGNGRYAEMTVFSFHPVKLIAAGEGGMVTTNDPKLYERLMDLRTHGITKDASRFLVREQAFTDGSPNPWYYELQELGFNYRLSDIHAALGLSQFTKIERFLTRRRELAQRYDEAFVSTELKPAQETSRSLNAHHLYVVRIPFSRSRSRNVFFDHLRSRGILPQVHYIPVHLQPYYRALGFKSGQFPVAERFYREAVSLPLYYGLSDEDQWRVIEAVKEALG